MAGAPRCEALRVTTGSPARAVHTQGPYWPPRCRIHARSSSQRLSSTHQEHQSVASPALFSHSKSHSRPIAASLGRLLPGQT
eukprot:1751643-Prymnesium_polylepis.1